MLESNNWINLGIYEKNIEIKSSAFQDGSDWGGSVVVDSIIAPPVAQTSQPSMKKPPLAANRFSNVP